ncbi:MAG TPA: hypothetical protein VJC15_01925 [Candidatus Paceibacterota bacterium]
MFILRGALLGSLMFVGIATAYAIRSFVLFWGDGRHMALAVGALLFAAAHALAAVVKYRVAFLRSISALSTLTILSAVVWGFMGAAAGFWLASTSSWEVMLLTVSALAVAGAYFGAALGFSVSYRLLAGALQAKSTDAAGRQLMGRILWQSVVPLVVLGGMGAGYQFLSNIYPDPVSGTITVGMIFLGWFAVALAIFRWVLLPWLQEKRRL